jgi:hypothetical protein
MFRNFDLAEAVEAIAADESRGLPTVVHEPLGSEVTCINIFTPGIDEIVAQMRTLANIK